MRALQLSLVALLAAGCGSTQSPHDISGFEPEALGDDGDDRENWEAFEELRERAIAERASDDGSEVNEGEPLPVEVLRPEPVVALTVDGRLRRAAIRAFHDRGPHAFLGSIELIPAREGDAALGYAIGAIGDDARFVLDGGLLPGDIVRTVNGEAIVMPDGFIAAWDGLVEADRIEIELIRDGQPMTLAWDVSDE